MVKLTHYQTASGAYGGSFIEYNRPGSTPYARTINDESAAETVARQLADMHDTGVCRWITQEE